MNARILIPILGLTLITSATSTVNAADDSSKKQHVSPYVKLELFHPVITQKTSSSTASINVSLVNNTPLGVPRDGQSIGLQTGSSITVRAVATVSLALRATLIAKLRASVQFIKPSGGGSSTVGEATETIDVPIESSAEATSRASEAIVSVIVDKHKKLDILTKELEQRVSHRARLSAEREATEQLNKTAWDLALKNPTSPLSAKVVANAKAQVATAEAQSKKQE